MASLASLNEALRPSLMIILSELRISGRREGGDVLFYWQDYAKTSVKPATETRNKVDAFMVTFDSFTGQMIPDIFS